MSITSTEQIRNEHYDTNLKNECEESMIQSMTTIRHRRKRKELE